MSSNYATIAHTTHLWSFAVVDPALVDARVAVQHVRLQPFRRLVRHLHACTTPHAQLKHILQTAIDETADA